MDQTGEDQLSHPRAEAFVLLGGLSLLSRNPLFLVALRDRGIAPLCVVPSSTTSPDRVASLRGETSHPLSWIADTLVIDSGDLAGLLAQVRSWQQQWRIVGVYSVGEILVEAAGVLAGALRLPSPGWTASHVCRSKLLQRLYLEDLSPRFTILPPGRRAGAAATHDDFPAVLKPTRRMSSSGVRYVADPRELAAHLDDYPPDEVLLVEARVKGLEVSVESVSQGGTVLFENVTRKRTTESQSAFFVEMAHTIGPGVVEPHEEAALLAAHRSVLERLEFDSGIAHAEYRFTDEGDVRLMEIAARTPGDGILPLYHLATGVPLEPELVRVALGEPTSYPPVRRWTRQVYLPHAVGQLQGVSTGGVAAEIDPVWVADTYLWPTPDPVGGRAGARVVQVLVLKPRGSMLALLRDSFDRSVTVLLDAPNQVDLDRLDDALSTAITIDVGEPTGSSLRPDERAAPVSG